MSKYRLNIREEMLIVEKRSLVLFWRWMFSSCREDTLNRMKNSLSTAKGTVRKLEYLIPKEELRLKDKKDALVKEMMAAGRVGGIPWRDGWRPRKEPVVLHDDLKKPVPKKKGGKDPPVPKPAVLFEATIPKR